MQTHLKKTPALGRHSPILEHVPGEVKPESGVQALFASLSCTVNKLYTCTFQTGKC